MIKKIQGDNQLTADAIFPVLLHEAEASNRNFLHVSMIINKESNSTCKNFETFEFLLQTLCLNLDSIILRKIIDMAGRLNTNNDNSADLFEAIEEFRDLFTKPEFIVSQDRTYYFSFLKIHPIKIVISFVPIKEDNNKKNILSGIASIGMALTTLESAPMKLYSVQLSDVFASEKRLKESLKNHYKSQVVNEFYSLIGHSNILGNPIGLLNDLGTGVVDFFYEPAQGMINGPISAGEGIIKGTSSLIKNTLSGTFGTVSKLTSSLTTGLAALTQDNDYILDRQKDLAKNKPNNIVDGVGLGVLSFMKNLGLGITGVVTEPIKGFKKDNVEGMMIGGLKGLSGLFVKPIAGALDMVSRSAEGIKNTANIFDETAVYKKIRQPRAIYGTSHGKKKYYEKEFVEQILGLDKNGKNVVVIFFTDLMIYLNVNKAKIIWKAPYRCVLGTEVRNDSFWVRVKNLKKRQENTFQTEFKNPQNTLAVKKKLMALMSANN